MPVQRSPSSISTRATTSAAAGKRPARISPQHSDDDADTAVPARPAPSTIPDFPAQTRYRCLADDPLNQSFLLKETASRFPAESRLQPDGSNFRIWLRELGELALLAFDNASFFQSDQSSTPAERIGRSLLLGSLHSSVKDDLYDLPTSHEMMKLLVSRFRTNSRASQLNKWFDLTRIPCDQSTGASALGSAYRNAFADLMDSGVTFSPDCFLGLLLHSSISHGTALRAEFDQRVDQELSWHDFQPLPFKTMLNILADCQAKVQARESGRTREHQSSAFAASPVPPRSLSIESHPDNVYALAGRPANFRSPAPTGRNCFRCGSTNHLISQCPTTDLRARRRLVHLPTRPMHSPRPRKQGPLITPAIRTILPFLFLPLLLILLLTLFPNLFLTPALRIT